MGELERHLRRAEADLQLARQAIEKAVDHVADHDDDALQFVRSLIAQVEGRVAKLRRRNGVAR